MATASASRIAALQSLGQATWMDFMSREFLDSGELARLIEEDNLQGVTSNPTIFDKAISHSDDYDAQMKELVGQGADADAIYVGLTTADIGRALDLFRATYDREAGEHGYVSLEVSPLMAHSTEETVSEAKRLWKALARPNAMIKIPGTQEGLPAIEEALFEGININVTLLFGVEEYEAVARTYVRALQRRAAQQHHLGALGSRHQLGRMAGGQHRRGVDAPELAGAHPADPFEGRAEGEVVAQFRRTPACRHCAEQRTEAALSDREAACWRGQKHWQGGDWSRRLQPRQLPSPSGLRAHQPLDGYGDLSDREPD